MGPRCLVFCLVALMAVAYVQARILSAQEYEDYVLKTKRQTHPEATVAQIGPSEENLPEPLPYLVPPRPDQIAAPSTPNGRWDLGFDASDILVPPLASSGSGQYETMKHTEPEDSGTVIVGKTKEAPRPPKELLAASNLPRDFLTSSGPVPNQDFIAGSRQPPELITAATNWAQPTSVLSFVKTDKEGHYKWGVRYNSP